MERERETDQMHIFYFLYVSLFSVPVGMMFGTGSAVAHRAVDAVMGPRTIQHETVASEAAAAPASSAASMGGSDACGMHTKAFQDVSQLSLNRWFSCLVNNDEYGGFCMQYLLTVGSPAVQYLAESHWLSVAF